MNSTALVIIALVAVVIAIGVFVLMRRRCSQSLREQFGPEYKRAVDQYGDQTKAEAELQRGRAEWRYGAGQHGGHLAFRR